MDLTDFSNQTLDEIVTKLNLLKIYLPFSLTQCNKVMDHKQFAQKVPAKSIFSESIWRYTDKIQIVAYFEDTLKAAKEFPLDRIIHVLDDIFTSVDQSDMTT